MKRRQFIHQSALAGSLLMMDPQLMLKRKYKHIGLQLWSVRDAVDADPAGTLMRLGKMGYKEVEGYKYENGKFYKYSPTEFKTVLADAGLVMPSVHSGITKEDWNPKTKMISDSCKRKIEDHAALGVKNLFCPHIDEKFRTVDYLHSLTETFNHVGEACKKHGIQFGYHNHDFEFRKLNDHYVMDILLGETDPHLVKMEMDLYWVRFANEDPVHWLNKYPGRIIAFHVKDIADTPQRESIEVGDGLIDFKTIFESKAARHVKYYIIELEHYRTNSMDGVAKSLKGLKKILGQA